jgi:hypothetical protein
MTVTIPLFLFKKKYVDLKRGTALPKSLTELSPPVYRFEA